MRKNNRNFGNYRSLPFNPTLRNRAIELRKAGNLPEVLMWKRLKNKQLKGYDFDRQKIIGNFIVDFFCADRNVIIEIDGSSHDAKPEYDAEREAFLTGLGLTVIHIDADDVLYEIDKVMDMLRGQKNLV